MDWDKLLNKGLRHVDKVHRNMEIITRKARQCGAIDRAKGREARPGWAVDALAELDGEWVKHWSIREDVKAAYMAGYESRK